MSIVCHATVLALRHAECVITAGMCNTCCRISRARFNLHCSSGDAVHSLKRLNILIIWNNGFNTVIRRRLLELNKIEHGIIVELRKWDGVSTNITISCKCVHVMEQIVASARIQACYHARNLHGNVLRISVSVTSAAPSTDV